MLSRFEGRGAGAMDAEVEEAGSLDRRNLPLTPATLPLRCRIPGVSTRPGDALGVAKPLPTRPCIPLPSGRIRLGVRGASVRPTYDCGLRGLDTREGVSIPTVEGTSSKVRCLCRTDDIDAGLSDRVDGVSGTSGSSLVAAFSGLEAVTELSLV